MRLDRLNFLSVSQMTRISIYVFYQCVWATTSEQALYLAVYFRPDKAQLLLLSRQRSRKLSWVADGKTLVADGRRRLGDPREPVLREIKALKTPADQGGGAVAVCSGAACGRSRFGALYLPLYVWRDEVFFLMYLTSCYGEIIPDRCRPSLGIFSFTFNILLWHLWLSSAGIF
jgi:hypothetical protein